MFTTTSLILLPVSPCATILHTLNLAERRVQGTRTSSGYHRRVGENTAGYATGVGGHAAVLVLVNLQELVTLGKTVLLTQRHARVTHRSHPTLHGRHHPTHTVLHPRGYHGSHTTAHASATLILIPAILTALVLVLVLCKIPTVSHVSNYKCEKICVIIEMPTEPSFLRSVSNSTVCTWFFIIACLNSLVALAIIVLVVMSARKLPTQQIITLVISSSVMFINAWFLFLMCNRSINKDGFKDDDSKEYKRSLNKL
jgi:hypothetical protein